MRLTVIVADTGAVLALVDRDDRHHAELLALYDLDPDAWVLPWAVLPEIDYLLARYVGSEAELAFLEDLAAARWAVEWGEADDLARAHALSDRYRDVGLGLVDAVVIAQAERLRAAAIATLDLRHFGAVRIEGEPRILPRDL